MTFVGPFQLEILHKSMIKKWLNNFCLIKKLQNKRKAEESSSIFPVPDDNWSLNHKI